LRIEPEINGKQDRAGGTGDLGQKHANQSFRRHPRTVSLIVAALAVMLGTLWLSFSRGHKTALHYTAFAQTPTSSAVKGAAVFTPARQSLADALKEYVGWQSTPVQPIAFNHKIHLQNNVECTSCHEGVTQGPDAGIPSVTFCMACHQAIAVDNPEIKKLPAYADKGQDVPWQRVYWFYPERHVRFWHSPHINAGLRCDECHGDLSRQTVAVRSKNLNMNFCLNCHRAKGVSVDCTTCHY
jgi:formylmethanofuran dehydrogenase subunit E